MKKLFTILSLLCLTMVAQAQEVTTWDTAGDLVTFEDFKASAGTGKRYAFRMPSISLRGWCNFQSKAAVDANNLQAENLFTLEKSANDEEAFWLKRFTDQKYLLDMVPGGSFDEFEGVDLYLDNRTPGFTDPEEQYSDAETMTAYYISMDNIEGNHANNGNFSFFSGAGGWSAYLAYGPIYVVKVVCKDLYDDDVAPPAYHFALDGATFTFTAPDVLGYEVTGGTEYTVTVNGADAEYRFEYEAVSSVTYTLNIVNAPEGVTLTIDGENVALDATEYVASRVLEKDDIEVDLGGLTYRYTVSIDGTTITIKFYDNRYGINFDPEQTYTHTVGGGRKTHWVALGDQKVEWEFQGVGVEPVYRDMTDSVIVVPAGATVTPAIGFEGQWMHGFFYIDLDNDGTYFVENPDHQTSWSEEPNGELVSYKNQGNVLTTSARNLPDITLPTTPGTYRVRFKVDWASTDPGGNTGDGDDPDDVTNSNHIVANGGAIIDVTLVVGEGHTVTYQVLNESGEVLTEKAAEVASGVTINSLPGDMILPDFYDYSEVTPVTVSGDVTITTTATLKENPIFKFTSDTTNPIWYTLTIKENYYPTYDFDAEPNVLLPGEDEGTANTLWAFIGSPYKGFQIVNQGAGTDLVLGSGDPTEDTDTGGETYATLAEPGSQTYELWFPKSSTYTKGGFYLFNKGGIALNHRSEDNLAYWTNGADKGSTFNAIDPEVAYHNLVDQLKNMPWGTGLNQYTFAYEGDDHTADAVDVITSIAPAEYSIENMAALKAKLEYAEITLNMPEPETFLRIKSVKQDSYVSSKTGIEVDPNINPGYANVYTTGAEADDPGTIFFYDGYTLLNYGNGMYTTGVQAAETDYNEGDDFEFSEASNGIGMYWIKPSSSNYWYGGTPTLDKWSNPATREETCFQLEEVTELPVTLAQGADGKYYATFSLPVEASAVSGATVNSVTVEGDKAIYTLIESDGIPSETGVLLVGESENATVTIGEFTGGYVLSSLIPMVEAEADIDGLFFNPESTDPFGFYKPTEGTTPRGFTAYLAYNETPVELVSDPTGIETIDNGQLTVDGAIYNLQGQKVKKAQKGVYIQNGRKVVLK